MQKEHFEYIYARFKTQLENTHWYNGWGNSLKRVVIADAQVWCFDEDRQLYDIRAGEHFVFVGMKKDDANQILKAMIETEVLFM